MKGNLYLQMPRPRKKLLAGSISADKTDLSWWDDQSKADGRVLAELLKAEIVFANRYGIKFKGYEPTGHDKAGRPTFKYQEWFISYL